MSVYQSFSIIFSNNLRKKLNPLKFGVFQISSEVVEIFQGSKRHLTQLKNAQICPTLTDLVTLMVSEFPMVRVVKQALSIRV